MAIGMQHLKAADDRRQETRMLTTRWAAACLPLRTGVLCGKERRCASVVPPAAQGSCVLWQRGGEVSHGAFLRAP